MHFVVIQFGFVWITEMFTVKETWKSFVHTVHIINITTTMLHIEYDLYSFHKFIMSFPFSV